MLASVGMPAMETCSSLGPIQVCITGWSLWVTAFTLIIQHWLLAGPVLGHTALLYAGAGAISGHNYSLWHKGWGGKGVAVTCTWLILYLPVTGALCCLAGGLAVLGLGYLPLGAVLIPTLAVPIAWVQYGPESGIILLLAAAMMFWRHKNGLHRIFLGQEKQFFRPKS